MSLGERGYMSIAESASRGADTYPIQSLGRIVRRKGMLARYLLGTHSRIIQVQLPKRDIVYCTIKYLPAFAESPF